MPPSASQARSCCPPGALPRAGEAGLLQLDAAFELRDADAAEDGGFVLAGTSSEGAALVAWVQAVDAAGAVSPPARLAESLSPRRVLAARDGWLWLAEGPLVHRLDPSGVPDPAFGYGGALSVDPDGAVDGVPGVDFTVGLAEAADGALVVLLEDQEGELGVAVVPAP